MSVAMGQSTSSQVVAAPEIRTNYIPITAAERGQWVVSNTLSPGNLMAGAVTSALATWSNSPPEYGPHWDGFAKSNGLRMSATATSSVMEVGLGSLWGEDPRYVPVRGQPFKQRLGNVFRMTVMARNRQGCPMPAYARYIAIPGSTFLSNTWRPDSQTQFGDAAGRISINLLGRVIGNSFSEFGPDLRKRFSRRSNVSADPGNYRN